VKETLTLIALASRDSEENLNKKINTWKQLYLYSYPTSLMVMFVLNLYYRYLENKSICMALCVI